MVEINVFWEILFCLDLKGCCFVQTRGIKKRLIAMLKISICLF